MEIIFNTLDKLEDLEKRNGKMGTVVGILIILVSTLFTIIGICALVYFNLSVFNWVINQLWFK